MRPTAALRVGHYRHLKLTTKDVNKGFYKGNRTGSMGRHTKYGGYVIEWNKVRTYPVPEGLKDFKVRRERPAASALGLSRVALHRTTALTLFSVFSSLLSSRNKSTPSRVTTRVCATVPRTLISMSSNGSATTASTKSKSVAISQVSYETA